MLIIVEGPDCARKSTLVERLSWELCKPYHSRRYLDVKHSSAPTRHPLDEYELPLLHYMRELHPVTMRSLNERHIICDRWHLGEVVYPAVFGRPTQMTEAVRLHVELTLAARGAVLVTIDSPVERLRECVAYRGDDVVTLDQLQEIRERFIDAGARSLLPTIMLESSDVDDWYAVSSIVELASVQQTYASDRDGYLTYAGPMWPKLLLLGDVRATGSAPHDMRPAFMPYGATSGAYLLDTLGDAVRRREVGVANACDVDDAEALWKSLNGPRTITLGRNAQRAAPFADGHAPHPQYWRRFHHHDRDGYRRLLLEGM